MITRSRDKMPLLAFYLLWGLSILTVCEAEDLYGLLGVTRKATTQEIKRAYRKKALDTHPDKNPDKNPEEAAALFHRVVQAFEVLSDPSSRRHYDQTGRAPNQNGGGGGGRQQQWGGGGFNFNFQFNFQQQRRPVHMKDKPEVKRAQSRLMHIISFEQFHTVLMEDDEERLERHVLLCAVNPQLEAYVMETMVFPFPFAGMSPQHIWWEDVLQTVLVRYHNQNELTQKLGLPKGQDLTEPIFLFGRKGQTIDDPWERLETKDRTTMDRWAWEQIKVEISFINYHTHPVEIYWIDGRRANLKVERLEPGQVNSHRTHLTHEWYIRDLRVDSRPDSPGRWKLTEQSTLITFQVLNATTPQVLAIPRRTCYDLSGHCPFWQGRGECRNNPKFMNGECPLTCKVCSDAQDLEAVEQAKKGAYIPPPDAASIAHEEL